MIDSPAHQGRPGQVAFDPSTGRAWIYTSEMWTSLGTGWRQEKGRTIRRGKGARETFLFMTEYFHSRFTTPTDDEVAEAVESIKKAVPQCQDG